MPTKNVSLSPQQAKFVHQSIKDGGFRNASEVVRAGLRLLEEQQRTYALKLQRLGRLSDLANEEIARGEYDLVEPDEIDAFMSKVGVRRGKRKSH